MHHMQKDNFRVRANERRHPNTGLFQRAFFRSRAKKDNKNNWKKAIGIASKKRQDVQGIRAGQQHKNRTGNSQVDGKIPRFDPASNYNQG